MTWLFVVLDAPQTVIAEIDPADTLTTQSYHDIYTSWVDAGYDEITTLQTINPEQMTADPSQLITRDDDRLVLSLDTLDTFSIDVSIDTTGLYAFSLDYVSTTDSIKPIKLSVEVNGESPYDEASRFELQTLWKQASEISQDRFGNDIVPTSYQIYDDLTFNFTDNVGLYDEPLLFLLEAGTQTLSFSVNDGSLDIYAFHLTSIQHPMSYEDYVNQYDADVINELISVEAEQISLKNDPSIRGGNHRDVNVTPFKLMESVLNILDGATFDHGRQSIYYDIEVPETGFYYITLKVLQNNMVNTNVYRNISIDGQIPFEEAKHIEFPYKRNFYYQTLSSDDVPLTFYFEEGTHQIGIHVDMTNIREVYEGILSIMADINATALDVQKITGNQDDEYRDWDLRDYMPTLESDLNGYASSIKSLYEAWVADHGKGASPITTSLRLAYKRMEDIAEKPNELPRNLTDFSVGSGSVLALIGNVLPQLISAPLSIDMIHVHGDDASLPAVRAGFFERLWVGIQRFFLSFFSDQYNVEPEADELEVWVNRSRAYVDLMQQMVDSIYTPATGNKVRVSLMPDENKLILANAAGAQPDVAVGVAAWRPFEFAVRDALVDLRQFDNFNDVSSRYASGAFTSLIYQDGVYALPETQNFQILFYRKDVLNTLNLEVPNTWYEVMDMLPELQRFGMNFYIPLANNAAFKSFDTTFPWIAQFGGKLYADDGFSVAYDDPNTMAALDMMTDLFKIYALPIEVGSFYQRFRYGDLPIGVGDFGMYVQLLNAAPEIAGLWDIELLPGIEQNGEINRSFVGASTVNMIFKGSDKQQAAWDFLTWWGEAETQVQYAENLLTTYGSAYLWNTAVIDAFSEMSWDIHHQEIILEQWQYIYDTVKVPGSYMVERELSNIWNKVVYNGVNLRTAIEDSTVIVNREITRKMIEFGYLDRYGNVLKPYFIPTSTTITEWRGA